MIHYKTLVLFYRKSDKQLVQICVDEPVDAIRERYIKAALDDKQLDMGEWSIDLNENVVLSIEQTMVSITEDAVARNLDGLVVARNSDGTIKFIKPVICRKWS